MPSEQHVRKTVTTERDIEVSDIFKVPGSYSRYYIVTGSHMDGDERVVELNARDGIYTVGESYSHEESAADIIEKLQKGDWVYNGIFAYEGTDINGNPVDYEAILTPEAYEELKEQNDQL